MVHDWAGVLSVPVAVVSSVRSTSRDRIMLWPTVPANSRSELVMDLLGFAVVTRCLHSSMGIVQREAKGP